MPKFIKTNFNPLQGALVVSFSALLGAFSFSGCSSPLKYKNLHENPRIISRNWVMNTRPMTFAADRGTEYSNAVLFENTLIFGNRTTGITSLYPKINQKRWELKIPRGVMSELAVDQNNLVFGGGDGVLYSVNAENGRISWKYEIKDPIVSRATFHAGRVFVTSSNDTVWAFDAGTGKWLWHYKRNSSQTATIMGASSPLVDGNEVLTGLSDGFFVALSLDEGQLKWERRLHYGVKFTDVHAHPVLENGIIYIPSYDGALYALRRQGGEVIWRFDAGGTRDVLIDHQRLYLPSSDGNLYCLQKSNARLIWKFELDAGVPTNSVVTDRYVLLGSSHQYFYTVDKDSGKPLSRFDVGSESGFYGSPIYDSESDMIYTVSSVGNLYSFQLRKPISRIRPHGQTFPYEF